MNRVLLIEDDHAVNRMISEFLRSHGWDVVSTLESREAGALFEKNSPDVVVTDLVMPHRDGLCVLAEIRSLDPEVPVIMLTGFATMERCREALRSGATDFLSKTCDPDELIAALCKAVEMRRDNIDLKLLAPLHETQFELRVSAALENKMAIIKRVIAAARESGYAKKAWAMRLALDEAFTNAVKHGADDDAAQSIVVRAQFTSDRGVVAVKDAGKGFDSESFHGRNMHDPGGRGLFLIRSFSDDARWTESGTRVEMIFTKPTEELSETT